jgi:formylmethanofuran dehydrogenase subunit E-like metal-binding protein
MKQKTLIVFVVSVLAVLILGHVQCGASAATFKEIVSETMAALFVARNDAGLLVMTNAPYVKIDGASALPYLDKVQQATGCTVGRGNLLFFQRPHSHPLRLMLYKKNNGDAVIISRENQTWTSEKLNIGAATISNPSFWETTGTFKAGADLFTLAAIANVWAKDVPYDFLKSAELHNHICPGLTSGYLMAHYILDRYPLEKGESYTIIACPVWCKEDAFQVVMDCTPGKKKLIVKQLSQAQKDNIAVADPAGMVLVWNAEKKSGKGVALSFDFDRLRALSPKDAPKAAMVLNVIDHLDKPDLFVAAAAEFDLNEALFNRIVQAGSNPYEVAGLTKK